MKKITKILMPIASVAAITAPAVTLASCSAGESFTFCKDGEWIEYQGEYKTEQPSGPMTLDGAKAFYFDAIAKDKSIFTHDMLYSDFWGPVYNAELTEDIDLSVSIKLNSVDKENFLLSFTMTQKYSTSVDDEGFNYTTVLYSTLTCVNFPFDVSYVKPENENIDSGWLLGPIQNLDSLKTADYNWSIKSHQQSKTILAGVEQSSVSNFAMNKETFDKTEIEENLPPAFFSKFMENVTMSH